MWNCNWGLGMGSGHGFGMGGFGGGLFGSIWMVLLVLLVVYIGIRIFRSTSPGQGNKPDRDDSLNILREKYARGEITDDEFRHMKDVLKN